MIFGIIIAFSYPAYRISAYIALSACTAFFIRGLTQKKNELFPLILLFFIYGYLSMQPYVAPEFPSDHVIHYADGDKWIITGVVEGKPIKDGDRVKFILNAETLGRNTPVSGRLRITVSGDVPDDLSAGDKVSFVSRIKAIRNFNNPGGFDYERFMAFQEVWATASVYGDLSELFEVLENKEIRGLEKFRREISDLIEETGPGKHVAILKALIIGEKNEIEQDAREDFSQAGIAHLFAISGLHIGIIATFTFIFFRRVLSSFGFFLWDMWPRKGAAVLSWFPIVAYGLLAGISASSSTQRAVIATTVFLTAIVLDEKHNSMNMLAIAAILILFIHPPSLFSVPFQLSFSAVFSIIYGFSRIHDKKAADKGNRMREKLFSFFLVSLFATLGTLPFIMFYYNQVTLVGLFANFIFIPVIGFVVVPLGVFSVFLYPFSIKYASLCIHISAFVLANTLETVTPTYFEIFGFYILGWAVLEIMAISPQTTDKEEQARRRRAKIVVVVIMLAGILNAHYWLKERFWHDDLRITVIDVGQGSSALVETPGGSCFLMDGGGFPDNSSFDVGERILAPFLLHKRIRTIDKIILSHADSDHLNGLLYIAGHFNVKEVWTNSEASDNPSYLRLMEIISKNRIDAPEFRDVIGEHEINGVYLEVLYPPKDFKEEKGRSLKGNDNSLVVKVTLGKMSFLFPGDIEAQAEKELVAMAGDKLKSTVLIAPHHGSKSSSTEEFLDAVSPEYVVISAGWKNRFFHPHPSVIERYERRGYKIYRTDESGAVSISADGDSVTAITLHISGFQNMTD